MKTHFQFKTGLSRKMRRCLIFCLLVVGSILFPLQAQAIDGNGTELTPYTINSAADLDQFRKYIYDAANSHTQFIGPEKRWKLTTDIDIQGSFDRLSDNNHTFNGIFDGDGHTITIHNTVFHNEFNAFFGVTSLATIENLNLVIDFFNGNSDLGWLIGRAVGSTTIRNVHIKANNVSQVSDRFWGALIGSVWNTKIGGGTYITIQGCSVEGHDNLSEPSVLLHGSGADQSYDAGGLIGFIGLGETADSVGHVLIEDCAVKLAGFKVMGNRKCIGGIVGSHSGRYPLIIKRCYVDVPVSKSVPAHGIVVGYANSPVHLEMIYIRQTGSYVGQLASSSTASYYNLYPFVGGLTGNNIYDMERYNEAPQGSFPEDQPGNRWWGYYREDMPKISKTSYAIKITKGSGVHNIDGLFASWYDDCFSNAGKPLEISPIPHPFDHQRIEYKFTPKYMLKPDSVPSYTATMGDNNVWLLTPYVDGTVSAQILNIPYPFKLAATFDQWEKTVGLYWEYNNPHGLTGKFYVYKRQTTSGSWTLIDDEGSAVGTGNGKTITQTHAIALSDFNKDFNYCIAFVEGTGAPPSSPNNIREYDRDTITVSTVPKLGSWGVTATGGESSINVSFTADSRFSNSAEYQYSVQRSINGGAFTDWLTNQSFSGDTSYYSHTDNIRNPSPCDSYRYRVVISAFNTTFSAESLEARITGNTEFAATDPLKVSKGEYANYVRLQWKIDRIPGGDPETFRIFRRVANSDDAFIELETITSNAATVYWNDMNALTGIYYEYRVTLYQTCTGEETELQSKNDIGFTQSFGTVSGRVTYGTGSAVPGVNMLVRRNDLQEGESQFRSLRSSGGGQKFEWLADPTYFNTIWGSKNWTLQFWVNPEAGITGTPIIGYIGDQAIQLKEAAEGGGYRLYTAMSTVNHSEIIPANHFSHITITRSGDNVKIYTVCDRAPDSIYIKNSVFPYSTATNLSAAHCKISFGHQLKGNVDDVRFWNRSLSEAEIWRDYSRRLIGNESGLKGYWSFDEALEGYAFDMSRVGTVYNGHHATTNGLEFSTKVPVDTYQLALKGITDSDGNYQIGGIPFVGEGSSYSIVPSLGVHQFNPTQQLRYISPTSMVHNATDFTDISSFELSGSVVYEGGNYPVSGCSFEIDDRAVTLPNGEMVKTDDFGNFTISVPIGIHKVRIVKQGHTFANGGLLTGATGENLNYNAPLSNITFYDQTRVKLIGRVVGGLIENDKPLGFGESVNNIGMQTLTLETTRPAYIFANNSKTETFYHNEGQWKKPGGLADDSTMVTYNEKNVTISVSPVTGEFVAYVYPEPYNILSISVPAAGVGRLTIRSNSEMIDLTNTPTIDERYMQTSIRTWTDSTYVEGIPGVVDHWEYSERSDTVRYHAEWKYYYQATPTFGVQQMVNGDPVPYFGEKEYTLIDPLNGDTITFSLYDPAQYPETSGYYLFGYPVFVQGETYTFGMNAYEEYSNYVSVPVSTVRYPVKEGVVNMTNSIKLNPAPETIEMDENGEAAYTFMAGAPNLTNGQNDFFATLTLGSISYYWDKGPSPVTGWHLGEKSTGTDFMTAGPDKIEIILRDPPGSNSKSFIEQGTTLVSKNSASVINSVAAATSLAMHLGLSFTTFVGLGAGVILETEVTNDLTLGIETEEKWTSTNSSTTTTTFTERFETSDDPLYVGHYGDVFIGNSTNILYGLTNGIRIIKMADIDLNHNPFATTGQYAIAPTVSVAFGQTFDTRFVFTTMDIEDVMIPKWSSALNILLKPVGTAVNTAAITEPVYVSKLPHDDEHFGKINMDQEAFGAEASPADSPDDGPSYKIYYPDNYDMALFEIDSVMYFNNQINLWTATLAQNEKEKVEMVHKGNYSFGGGSSTTISETTETEKATTSSFTWMLNPTIGHQFGATVSKVGITTEFKIGYKHEEEATQETTATTSINTGFTLQENGAGDQITVDYGMTESGTYGFKTRGGRTSCPHEDLLVTQYYEPGQHVLSEATMQIEVPRIRVASAPAVLNVPANKEAAFVLALENESETDYDAFFELIVDEATNPHGAILKVDGTAIGNGRTFLVRAGQTLHKVLTVGKGMVDRYDNIGLILRSPCQNDLTDFWPVIADTCFVTVEFIPAVTDVAIDEPKQNWILNADSQTGDTLYVTLNQYDVNFPNFGYIKLEYRPISSPNWNTIMTFYPPHLYENAQGLKEDIGTRPVIIYPWKTPTADGAYELRATAASVNSVDGHIIGDPLATYTTEAVSGYKDVTRPKSLGAPSPANGILGIGDELSVTFNEDIQTGMITPNNFTISGILNAQEIAEPNVGLAFAGTQSAQTELPIFTNGSFSIETWFKREIGSAGTLFSFGSNNTNISLGFNAGGNAILKIGNETHTSPTAIADDETWKYIALVYNRDAGTVSVYEYEGATNKKLFTNQSFIIPLETQGRLVVGNDFNLQNGFNGAIAQLSFYGVYREEAAITADKSINKSGREYGLIGYWVLDEGEGSMAKDKARSRHLTLNTDWYIYPSGYAKQTDSNYFAITTSSYPLNQFCDFTLEFWFRSSGTNQPGQTLFSADHGYISTNESGGLTLYKNDTTVIRALTTNNLIDTKWHHIAMSVRRGGSVNVYIDGISTAVFAESLLGTFSSGFYYFGAKRTPPNSYSNYFAGHFDEIRIWNSALTREGIVLNKNSKLYGDEAGLQAYYPFETYTQQSNGLISVTGTNANMTDSNEASGAGMSFTTGMSVKDVRPVEEVPYVHVASSNKIVFHLNDSYFARVEGATLTITVKDIYDMHNNRSNTEQWTAYVKRNPLQWDTDPIYIRMEEGETRTFTAKIVNVGGTSISYSIENLPSWLTISQSAGNLQPLGNKELTFTVKEGTNIGNYESAIGLNCGNGVSEILPVQVKVTGVRPDWEVNPHDFEFSMNIIGQIQINGLFQEDSDDLLAAFIGDLCVGVTSPFYVNANNAWFTFFDIYGNAEHNNQLLKFKLWDASTGNVYPVIETSIAEIRFLPSQLLGNLDVPVLFNALDYMQQTIPLKKGWTWVSTHLINDNPTILDQMKTSLADVGLLIKGRNAYIQQPGWLGTLGSISEKSMYMINTTEDHALVLSGVSTDAAATSIPINQGWNWIGYVPTINLAVPDALAGLDARTGDQIKGQSGFAIYTSGSEWIGNLAPMQAGKGYMYFSTSDTPKTFTYPSTPRGGAPMNPDPSFTPPLALNNPIEGITPRWIANDSQYPNSVTLMGIVLNNGTEIRSESVEVGAFSGAECRGSAFLQYIDYHDSYMCFLMIYGEGSVDITLKVYDHATNTEYDANNPAFTFIANEMLGSPDNPYPIEIGTGVINITLSNLTVSEGVLTPEFSSTTYHYTVNVANDISSLIITATSEDPDAIIEGDGEKSLSGGSNLFTITVFSSDGLVSSTYTVTVNRAATANATLSNLTISEGTLSPPFSSDIYTYAVDVPYSISNLTLTGTPTDPQAIVVGNGLKLLDIGANPFDIIVMAQDGETQSTYTVTVNRAKNNDATLAVIAVSNGTLTPGFNSNTYSYSVGVPYSITTITLTGIPTDRSATVTGTGVKTLDVGDNLFDIIVTAQDGETQLTYTVTINRAKNNDATLSGLTVSEGTLTPAFSSNIYSYSVEVPYSMDNNILTNAITITGTATDTNATVVGNVVDAPLNSGDNPFIITVTAQDEVTTKTYTVTVIATEKSTITATAGANGTISPNGNILVNVGDHQNFTFTADNGYEVHQLLIDGVHVPDSIAGGSYTFKNVTEDHTIAVTFKVIAVGEQILFTWNADANSEKSFEIRATAGKDFIVDWGDGTTNTYTGNGDNDILITHSYNSTASYFVSVSASTTDGYVAYLYCPYNELTALDVSGATALTYLYCDNNQLTALDVSTNTALTYLYCDNNQLTALDVSTNTALTYLECYNNQLTALDVSTNTALINLYCDNNQLTALDVSTNTALSTLWCNNNQLTALDLSQNSALITLYCYSNQLTALDVSTNTALINLYCDNNQLTALDVSTNTALINLYCYNNQLTALNLSQNSALADLACSNNQLTALDISTNTALSTLWCGNNQLTALDISTNPALRELYCYNNQLTALDVSQNSALTYLYCYNNQLTFSTLPLPPYSDYWYTPQAKINGGIAPGFVDLSSEYNIDGNVTLYTWYEVTGTAELSISPDRYTDHGDGTFTFGSEFNDKPLRCKMTNATFPDFTASDPLVYEVTIGTHVQYTITATAGSNGTITPNGAILVDEGDHQTFTFIANNGYEVDELLIDEVNVPDSIAGGSYTFENVTEDHTIEVTFKPIPPTTYIITATAGENGTIDPEGEITVTEGDNQTFTFIANNGYEVYQLLIDGVHVPDSIAGGSYTFVDVTEDHTIEVTFKPIPPATYIITATAGENGSIDPEGEITVTEGDNQTFTFIADNGYEVDELLIDEVNVPDSIAGGSYTFVDVTEDHTIEVTFKSIPPTTYTISASAGENGSIDPEGEITVTEGDNQTFTFIANNGYEVYQLLIDEVNVPDSIAGGSYTFVDVTEDHTIEVTFKSIPPTTYIITATAGENGTIDPEGEITVIEGDHQTFTFTANNGYEVDELLVDNVNIADSIAGGSYTFENVTEDHSIEVTFKPIPPATYIITATAGENGAIDPEGEITVTEGDNQTFTFIANNGYEVYQLLIDNVNVPDSIAGGSYTFVDVTEDHTIEVTFKSIPPATYTISASAGENGNIDPEGEITVTEGDNQTFTFIANNGYEVDELLIDEVNVPDSIAGGSYTFVDVTEDHTIEVTFKPIPPATYIITATAGENGSIDPEGEITVTEGDNQTFTFTANNGYEVDELLIDEVNVPDSIAGGSYTFVDVTEDHSIEVTFKSIPPDTYIITATAGENGTIDPEGEITVIEGDNQTFTFTANNGYEVDELLIDEVNVPDSIAGGSYTFVDVTEDHSIEVTFKSIPPATYIISASAGENGSIDPEGEITVTEGDNQTFTFIANNGYEVYQLLIDEVNVPDSIAGGSYTFVGVTEDHSIAVIFKVIAVGEQILFTWNANANSEKSFTLRATAGKAFVVDWGDGTTNTYTGNGYNNVIITHSYNSTASYFVSVSASTTDGHFTYLNCSNNQLTALDVRQNSALTNLYCNDNQLTALDVSTNTALSTLWCNNNQLTALDVSQNSALEYLRCHYNQLTALNVSNNTALTYLDCSYNQLTALDVSDATELTVLRCYNNQLTALDVSGATALTDLYCNGNQLTALDVSTHTELNILWCPYNQLTALDVSGATALTNLQCHNNQLTALDVSPNTALMELYCSNNQLTALDVSQNSALTNLRCFNNLLTALDVRQNSALTELYCYNNQLTALDVSQNSALTNLRCHNNQLTALDVSTNTTLSTLWCYNNQLKFSTLPLPPYSNYQYTPQAKINGGIAPGFVDLSSEYSIQENITVYSWYEVNVDMETEIPSANYTDHGNGTFTFGAAFDTKTLRCRMTNVTFPAFTASAPLVYEVTIEAPVQYTITATAGSNGTITPNGAILVDEGDHQTFTFIADNGYEVYQLLIDEVNVPDSIAGGSYTFVDVTEDHTIEVTFKVVPVSNIELLGCPENGLLANGATCQLQAVVFPDNDLNKKVVWSSTNPNTAIVDATGKVTAKSTGVTYIIAKVQEGDAADTCHIRVVQPVSGIVLTPAQATLLLDEEKQLMAKVLPENATIRDIIWSSSDETAVTVDAHGKITGIAAGEGVITAKTVDGDFEATCRVTVFDAYAPATGVTVTPKTLAIGRGETYQLSAEVKPANASQMVTWSSNNPVVATVAADGTVTALAAGKATITAKTDNNYKATCAVTVTIPIDSIVVTPDEWILPLKGAKALKATVYPSDASNKTIKWSSANTALATVSATGVVTAKNTNGVVEIYATNTASGISGICVITVGTGIPAAPPMDISEENTSNHIVLYPNPTTGKVTIKSTSLVGRPGGAIKVFDMTGRLVLEMNHVDDNEVILDLSGYAAGVYFINVDGKTMKVVKK